MGNYAHSMDMPMKQVGKKRPAEISEPLEPTPKEGRIETPEQKQKIIEEKIKELQAHASLPALPPELISKIYGYLITAKGFGREKLYNAARNIRNFLITSKATSNYLYHEPFNEFLINELAKTYNTDKVAAAIALHTVGAQKWLAHENFVSHDITKYFVKALKEKDTDVVEWLEKIIRKTPGFLQHYYQDEEGMTPLMAAVSVNNIPLIEYILSPTPNVGANMINISTDDKKKTALSYAARNGNLEAMALLMNAGAKVFWPSEEDAHEEIETPLIDAIRAGNIEAVNMLLTPEMVQKINANVWQGLNLLEYTLLYATKNKNAIVERLLKVPGISLLGALFGARGDVESTKLLLNAGASVHDLFQEEGIVIATIMAYGSDVEIKKSVELLIGHGADYEDAGQGGQTPLIAAVQGGLVQTVKLLLEKGADTLTRDDAEKTALDYANELEIPQKAAIVALLEAAQKKQEAAREESDE